MNKNELVEIIREVVRAELRNSGPALIREALLETLSSGERTISESQRPKTVQPQQRDVAPAPLKKKEQRVFSSNPAINAILNETTGGIPQDPSAPVAEMDGSMPIGQKSTIDVISSIPQEQLDENPAVAAVASALTKDYRSLLKAADSKAKSNYRR